MTWIFNRKSIMNRWIFVALKRTIDIEKSYNTSNLCKQIMKGIKDMIKDNDR